jgi:ABC-type sugar transport system ATPase subunit
MTGARPSLQPPPAHQPPALRITGASRTFGATRALDDVSFDVRRGEIHALIGENGAGKSTLIKIVSGVYRADAGRIEVDGVQTGFSSPAGAMAAGIATIPQELRLVPGLSVAENICLGHWPRKWGGLAIDRAAMRRDAAEVLRQVGHPIAPDIPVGRLDFAERQLIVIARALRLDPRVLILDEPTAALERREAERLFAVLDRLRAQGTAIVYVSHKLHEIVRLADRCTVLRDGRVVDVLARGGLDVADLVRKMTGRTLEPVAAGVAATGAPVLRSDLVTVRDGEVVGLGGLLGWAGRAHVFGLFGAEAPVPVHLHEGPRRSFAGPRAAKAAGLGLVPGERIRGLVMQMSVRDNIVLPNLPQGLAALRVPRRYQDALVRAMITELDIRPADPDLPVAGLSGGNQQKVILARWLARQTGILLLDEPTHGIDMAAKAQIHRALRAFVAGGKAALVSSTDSEELLQICDRIVALRDGEAVGAVDRATGMSEERLRELIGG